MRSVGVWALLLAGGVAVGAAGFAPLMKVDHGLSVVGSRLSVTTAAVAYPAESLGAIVVAHDLFRAARRPADVAYDPVRLGQLVAAPVQPKPTLILTGIVSGTEPQAVIEGWPGVDGPRVVQAGDVVSGLKVKRIEGTRVTVVGMDTTWVLQVREPWRQ